VSGELLLQWASECGDGSWELFRDAAEWLTGRGHRAYLLNRLAMLGHLEVDWPASRWAIAPSVVTLLPRSGGQAVLCGARTRALLDRLYAEDELDIYVQAVPQADAPDAIFISSDGEDTLISLANAMAASYETCVSDELAHLLPSLDGMLGQHPFPPPRTFEARRFDPRRLEWEETESRRPGLFHFQVFGRPTFLVHTEDGRWLRVEPEAGVYAELRSARRNVIAFAPDSETGTLIIPRAAPLPPLHARTAALASGLVPYAGRSDSQCYVNVPQETALRIAGSLGQTLAEAPAPAAAFAR
jgi:hypothetical protein